MSKETLTLPVLVLVGSMAGGAISSALLTRPVEAQGPDVVTASQINIVDGAGTLRALLSASDETGRTTLAFYAATGERRGFIGVDPDGTPHLQFTDPAGAPRLEATLSGGDPSITLGDARARNVTLGAMNDTPLVALSHGGQSRMQASLAPGGRPNLSLQGEPSIDLLGAPGQRGISFSVGSDGAPFASFYDAAGAQRIAVGAVQGTAVVNLGDGTRPRLVLGVAPDGEGSIAYYSNEGELVRLEAAAGSAPAGSGPAAR